MESTNIFKDNLPVLNYSKDRGQTLYAPLTFRLQDIPGSERGSNPNDSTAATEMTIIRGMPQLVM